MDEAASLKSVIYWMTVGIEADGRRRSLAPFDGIKALRTGTVSVRPLEKYVGNTVAV